MKIRARAYFGESGGEALSAVAGLVGFRYDERIFVSRRKDIRVT